MKHNDITSWIRSMPKAELHVHLEGAIDPDLMIEMARRNRIAFPYASAAELRAACAFTDLQSFLDLLWLGNDVLRTERDFFDMTLSYLARAHADAVVRAEMFLSPQAHLSRGISFDTVMAGVLPAMAEARKAFGIDSALIIGVQRHRSEQEGFDLVEMALAYRADILGIGLGSAEVGNPPSKFARLFARCREAGWHLVAHAGEEGPAAYVKEAVDILKVERIDHGVRCEEDPGLVRRLAELGIPLTVCPLSNVKLGVVPSLQSHNLKRLLHAGLRVTVNSDDPTFFGGYVNDNFVACHEALALTRDELLALCRNSLLACFVSDEEKRRYCGVLTQYAAA